jgi:hypothetical protein
MAFDTFINQNPTQFCNAEPCFETESKPRVACGAAKLASNFAAALASVSFPYVLCSF